MSAKPVSDFWLLVGALGLSLAWVLPNHAPPWTAFHSDAWAALQLSAMGCWLAFWVKDKIGWNVLTTTVAFACLLPWLQFAAGQILSFGTAWINFIYLLGFLFAIQTGERWESTQSGKALSYVLGAALMGSLVSLGILYFQWTANQPVGPWTLAVASGQRLSANMAQPNQLTSLLMLGVLGCSWGYCRAWLKAPFAVVLVCFILFGVALIGSRTAWLNISLLLIGVFFYQHTFPQRRYVWGALGLGVFYVACVLSVPIINETLSIPNSGANFEYRTLDDPVRLAAWKMFFEASLRQPIFGYGWGQIFSANFLIVGDHSAINGLFSSSHNILLDLILWSGYPVGIILIGVVVWWVFRVLRKLNTYEQLHSIAILMVLGVHAMLEYPLHYAYFLLPFGLVVGVLQSSLEPTKPLRGEGWRRIILPFVAIVCLTITIRDYMIVENRFYGLRFEMRNIPTDIPKSPPEVMVLKQFKDYFTLARNSPSGDLGSEALEDMKASVETLPSAQNIYKLAANLAMNGRPVEAGRWLFLLCKTTPDPNCELMRMRWKAEGNDEIAKVPWPREFDK